MNLLNFAILQGNKKQAYDNIGAHAEVIKMMKRGDKLSVRFKTSKTTQHPYAWVESKTVAGFMYELDNERTNLLIRYMMTGEVSEYTGDPMKSDIMKDGEDYQWVVLKEFIEEGHTLQYTPLFREYNDRISAMKAMFKGTVRFSIPRTPEILDYLREMKQDI